MSVEDITQDFLTELAAWVADRRGNLPPGHTNRRYVTCTGLALLEQMREEYPFKTGSFETEKGQAKTSKGRIQRILARFGEERILVKEGGRTTRGAAKAQGDLAKRLNACKLGSAFAKLSDENKDKVVTELQRWLYENEVLAFFNRQRIKVEIDLSKSTYQIVADILAVATEKGQCPAVAEHLVGAKLAVKFPDLDIPTRPYTGADDQVGEPGDFRVRDTAFHVTVAPGADVLEKCRNNLVEGFRAVLLVPDERRDAAWQNAAILDIAERVFVDSIEAFVGRNIEEAAGFSAEQLAEDLLVVLQKYNERVAEVETDLSMLIEIPRNLSGATSSG